MRTFTYYSVACKSIQGTGFPNKVKQDECQGKGGRLWQGGGMNIGYAQAIGEDGRADSNSGGALLSFF